MFVNMDTLFKDSLMIPEEHQHRYAYHFTSVENLDSILSNGMLSTSLKKSKSISHTDISLKDIQNRRQDMLVPCLPPKKVHDFVPLYFSKRTPMLLSVLRTKNIDQFYIIYFAVPISLIDRDDVVFSDAAANTLIPPNFYSNPENLNKLDWKEIDSWDWNPPSPRKQKKMAEMLILDELKISDVSYIVVWNDSVAQYIKKLFNEKNIPCPRIQCFDATHYFMDLQNKGKTSAIIGPIELKQKVDSLVEKICTSSKNPKKFASLQEANIAIHKNFSCIPELSEIEGLKTSNIIHHEDIGAHSRTVAKNATSTPEYQNLNIQNKNILVFASFLHDIGKGPKSRWKDGIQHVDHNHAVKALPMLERILSEDIAELTQECIRKIVTLVIYDDLVGDIIAKHRDKKQFFDIITCNEDIDMLIAISKSDIGAINTTWLEDSIAPMELLKIEARKHLLAR